MEPYVMRSLLLISLFAFVGTQARNLLDHCNGFKAETNVGRQSKPPPPAPFSSPPHKEVSKFSPNNMLEKPNTNPVSMITSKNKQTLDSAPALRNYVKRGRLPPPPSPELPAYAPPIIEQRSSNPSKLCKETKVATSSISGVTASAPPIIEQCTGDVQEITVQDLPVNNLRLF
ncbi:Uncharacterized protein Adt_45659 [Abeliophyllum distichum]|uniref:Uncharacterized protein n=1 Tax=Abeliophyllum distichum TaxID=126358 RepID=A0ABD1PF22_9LAMI